MESQMIASLKRASADVVHNMSKEAAMRILVAERKALRFQQELFSTKEEALNMLLRLKQIMDSKIAEADKASLCQARRIKELEAQLKETENTVSDLRKELKITSDELEKMRSNQTQPLDEQTSEEHSAPIYEDMCHENKLEASNSSLSPRTVVSDAKAITLTQQPVSELPAKTPDLASIIMRTKEPESYRNGCTQRIRAFEQKPHTGKVNIPGKSDALCLNSDYQSVDGGKQARDEGQVFKFFRRCSRKQKARSKYGKNTGSEKCSSQENKDYKDTSILCEHLGRQTDYQSVDGIERACDKGQAVKFFHRCSGKQKPRSKSGRNTGGEKCCSQENKDHKDASTEHPEKQTGQGVVAGYKDDGEITVEEPQLMRQDSEVVEDAADITPIEEDLEKIDVPSMMVSDSKDEKDCKSVAAPVQGVNDRLLKFTFRRKRKRNASNHDENVLPEKTNTSKRRATEKTSLVMESSRDSRRLAQVARQLISLSEKRWW